MTKPMPDALQYGVVVSQFPPHEALSVTMYELDPPVATIMGPFDSKEAADTYAIAVSKHRQTAVVLIMKKEIA